MRRTRTFFLKTSLLLSLSSFLLAMVSIHAGQRVNYLDHLTIFSIMALSMVGLAIAATITALIGLWKTRGRSLPLWFANVLSIGILTIYIFDS